MEKISKETIESKLEFYKTIKQKTKEIVIELEKIVESFNKIIEIDG